MSIKSLVSKVISHAIILGLPIYAFISGSLIAANITAVVLSLWAIIVLCVMCMMALGYVLLEYPGLEKESKDKLIKSYHTKRPFGAIGSFLLNLALVATFAVTGYILASVIAAIVWLISWYVISSVRKKYPMELVVVPAKE